MNKIRNKSKLLRYVSVFLVVFIALYLTFRVISLNNGTYKTSTTLLKTVEKSIDTTVFIVRDEEYLNVIDDNKTSVSLISDGERVCQDEVISAMFDSDEDAEKYKKRLYYESELERYNELLSQEKINISDIMTYDSKTNDLFSNYVGSIRNDSFDEARNYISDFCNKLTSRQSSMGVEIDISGKINELNEKINQLKYITPEYVMSKSTGYYVSGIDGYENVIKYDDVMNVTTKMIDDAIKSDRKPTESYAGKIINNFNWYMLCCTTAKDVQDVEVGDYVNVRFVNASSTEEKAEIVAINAQTKDEVALVLRCNTVTSKVFPLRKEKVKIITEKVEGYAVNKDAVRNVDGVNGVYVLRGKIINFRIVDIIYTSDDFVLVRTFEDENEINNNRPHKKEGNENVQLQININKYIRLYDEVIIKGSDLSDGKIIQ